MARAGKSAAGKFNEETALRMASPNDGGGARKRTSMMKLEEHDDAPPSGPLEEMRPRSRKLCSILGNPAYDSECASAFYSSSCTTGCRTYVNSLGFNLCCTSDCCDASVTTPSPVASTPSPVASTPSPIASTPLSDCDFDTDMCGFSNPGVYDWTRILGGTPSSDTGPSGDHTSGSGYYMYVEATVPNSPSVGPFLLESTVSSIDTVAFWYHMYGSTMGDLSFYSSSDDGATWTLAWSKSGNQGNAWHSASVSISGDATKIRFSATTGSDWASDIAIDDIVASTPSPVASTPSPVASTPSPVASTPSPVASTPSPIAPSPSPVASTPSPIAPSPSPTATTSGCYQNTNYPSCSGYESCGYTCVENLEGLWDCAYDGSRGCLCSCSACATYYPDRWFVEWTGTCELTNPMNLTYAPTSSPTYYCEDVPITLEDSYGDGWNGNVLYIGDVSLSLDDYDTSFVTGTICLEPGVYTPYCCGGSYDSEVSWSVGGLSGGADDTCVGTAGSFTVAPETPSSYDCDFDTDMCSFSNPGVLYDWTRYSGGTPSSDTGPSGDHTSGSGYYMYVEASSPNYPSVGPFLLESTVSSIDTVAFWYHMYGSTMGDLSFYSSSDDGATWTLAWSKSGNQGNAWHSASVSISGDATKIQFSATTGPDFESDIAIDDITMTGAIPTKAPSSQPTHFPTLNPTGNPSLSPTASPNPSLQPSFSPTPRPSQMPSPIPTSPPSSLDQVTVAISGLTISARAIPATEDESALKSIIANQTGFLESAVRDFSVTIATNSNQSRLRRLTTGNITWEVEFSISTPLSSVSESSSDELADSITSALESPSFTEAIINNPELRDTVKKVDTSSLILVIQTRNPSTSPTPLPTYSFPPTSQPTAFPSLPPTPSPSLSRHPTQIPVPQPTPKPTLGPLPQPSPKPSFLPTPRPSHLPIPIPTAQPTKKPTETPTKYDVNNKKLWKNENPWETGIIDDLEDVCRKPFPQELKDLFLELGPALLGATLLALWKLFLVGVGANSEGNDKIASELIKEFDTWICRFLAFSIILDSIAYIITMREYGITGNGDSRCEFHIQMAIPLTKAYYLGMPVYINHLLQRRGYIENEEILPLEAYPILFFVIVPIAAGFFYMIPALILHIYFPVVVFLGMIIALILLYCIGLMSADDDDEKKRDKFILILSAPAAMAALCFLAFMSIHFTRQYYVPPPHGGSKQFNRNYRYLMRSGFAQLAIDGPSLAFSFSWPSGVPDFPQVTLGFTLALVIIREFIQSIVGGLCVRRFITGEIETPMLDDAVGTIGSAAVISVSTAVSSVGAVAEKSYEASIEMSDKIRGVKI